ncbi:hypothetical protein BH10PSE14_BH10PSE14_17680 [soil metagenome]
MTDEEKYRAATLRAETSRLLLADAWSTARERVSSERLKADAQARLKWAVDEGRAQARAAIRRHPLAIGLGAAGLLTFLFRRPLMALSRRLFVLGRNGFRARNISEDEL